MGQVIPIKPTRSHQPPKYEYKKKIKKIPVLGSKFNLCYLSESGKGRIQKANYRKTSSIGLELGAPCAKETISLFSINESKIHMAMDSMAITKRRFL